MAPLPNEEAWVTRDYGGEGRGLSMSKSALGLFAFHVLRLRGRITSTYAMRPDMDRTYVQFAIVLPKGRAAELTELTGVALEKPSTLVPA